MQIVARAMSIDLLLGAQVPPLRDGEPLCLSPTLLRAWSTRTQQVDTGEAAALAVLHRTDPAHSPATFSHALGELFLPAGGRRRRSRGRGRARPGTAALAPDAAPRKRPADAELGLSKLFFGPERCGLRAYKSAELPPHQDEPLVVGDVGSEAAGGGEGSGGAEGGCGDGCVGQGAAEGGPPAKRARVAGGAVLTY